MALLIAGLAGSYIFGDVSGPSTSEAAGGASETPHASKELLATLEGRWVEINGPDDESRASVIWFHLWNKDGRFDADRKGYGDYTELSSTRTQQHGNIIRLSGTVVEAVQSGDQTVPYRYRNGRLEGINDAAVFEFRSSGKK